MKKVTKKNQSHALEKKSSQKNKTEKVLDKMLKDTFPASDPTAKY